MKDAVSAVQNQDDIEDVEEMLYEKKNLTSRCETEDPALQQAFVALTQSGFFEQFGPTNLFNNDKKESSDPYEPAMTLRMQIPFQPRLLQRMVRLQRGLKPGSSSRSNGLSALSSKLPFCKFGFNNQFSLYSSRNLAEVLQESQNKEFNTTKGLMFVVLWALQDTLPSVFNKLMQHDMGCKNTKYESEPKKRQLAPIPYNDKEPAFVFRDGDWLEKSSIHPTELVNTLITGTTGAGKTYGGVIPLLQSFLAYKNAQNQPMSMLVIDPKHELEAVCERELAQLGESERLLRLGHGQRLRYFNHDCSLSLMDRYRALAELASVKAEGESKTWKEKSHRMNMSFLQQDRTFYLASGYSLLGLAHSIITGKDYTQDSVWLNLMTLYKFALTSSDHLIWLHHVLSILMGLFTDAEWMESEFKPYAQQGRSDMQDQFFYRADNAMDICVNLSQPEVIATINTDLYPTTENDLEVDQLVLQGKVLILQPRTDSSGDITGRLIKARFFCDIFERSDMRIPIAYVADEFQRFITSDRDTGEQSFLDRCRAYRVNCVLATQSITSLQHALAHDKLSTAELSTRIIVANSPTKLIFRSTDPETNHQMRYWLPSAPDNLRHVVDVRPIASLKTGYAYYLCNGDWGYYQYQLRPKLKTVRASTAV